MILLSLLMICSPVLFSQEPFQVIVCAETLLIMDMVRAAYITCAEGFHSKRISFVWLAWGGELSWSTKVDMRCICISVTCPYSCLGFELLSSTCSLSYPTFHCRIIFSFNLLLYNSNALWSSARPCVTRGSHWPAGRDLQWGGESVEGRMSQKTMWKKREYVFYWLHYECSFDRSVLQSRVTAWAQDCSVRWTQCLRRRPVMCCRPWASVWWAGTTHIPPSTPTPLCGT